MADKNYHQKAHSEATRFKVAVGLSMLADPALVGACINEAGHRLYFDKGPRLDSKQFPAVTLDVTVLEGTIEEIMSKVRMSLERAATSVAAGVPGRDIQHLATRAQPGAATVETFSPRQDR